VCPPFLFPFHCCLQRYAFMAALTTVHAALSFTFARSPLLLGWCVAAGARFAYDSHLALWGVGGRRLQVLERVGQSCGALVLAATSALRFYYSSSSSSSASSASATPSFLPAVHELFWCELVAGGMLFAANASVKKPGLWQRLVFLAVHWPLTVLCTALWFDHAPLLLMNLLAVCAALALLPPCFDINNNRNNNNNNNNVGTAALRRSGLWWIPAQGVVWLSVLAAALRWNSALLFAAASVGAGGVLLVQGVVQMLELRGEWLLSFIAPFPLLNCLLQLLHGIVMAGSMFHRERRATTLAVFWFGVLCALRYTLAHPDLTSLPAARWLLHGAYASAYQFVPALICSLLIAVNHSAWMSRFGDAAGARARPAVSSDGYRLYLWCVPYAVCALALSVSHLKEVVALVPSLVAGDPFSAANLMALPLLSHVVSVNLDVDSLYFERERALQVANNNNNNARATQRPASQQRMPHFAAYHFLIAAMSDAALVVAYAYQAQALYYAAVLLLTICNSKLFPAHNWFWRWMYLCVNVMAAGIGFASAGLLSLTVGVVGVLAYLVHM
jgi:hypothetical protein